MDGVSAKAKSRDLMWNQNVLLVLAKPCPVGDLVVVISESLQGWIKTGNMEDCLLSPFPTPLFS